MRPRTGYISQRTFAHNPWKQPKDDTVDYKFHWNDFAVSQGTTLSSVAYSTRSGNLTVANNNVSSGTATAQFTFSSIGRKNVRMTGTMADGTTHNRNQIIEVYDPVDLETYSDIWGRT